VSTCRPGAGKPVVRPEAPASSLRAAALRVAQRHFAWREEYGSLSWDPYDFWAHPLGQRAKAAYYRHQRLGLPLIAPFVVLDTVAPRSRAAVGGRRRFPVADAHYAMGLCELARGGTRAWLRRATPFLEALVEERCPAEAEYCWGYPFDWVTCVGTWPSGTPLITSTPYGYEAFEAAFALTGSDECLAIMESVGRFAFERIPATEVSAGVRASAYTPTDHRRVVNASAYRGFLLAAAGTRFGHAEWVREARAAVAFVLRSQRLDGSWLYAMDGEDAFVDNLHTCFVLKNLVKYQRVVTDDAVADAVARGYEFYKASLLDDEHLPVPFAKAPRATLHVRDVYDYAEGINLALLLRNADPDARAIADALVGDILRHWVLDDGRFVSRQMLVGRNTVPYLRWGQAQTFRALACYASIGEG